MADGFRYSLTRVCLRTGSLTLPLKLLGVFPERGEVTAIDSAKGAEFTLQVDGRQVRGLDDFYLEHQLTPSDDILIELSSEGRFSFLPAKRQRRDGPSDSEKRASSLIEEVLAAGVPLSEGEIRTLHPKLAMGLDLRATLSADPRLAIVQGRWQSRIAAEQARQEQHRRASERSQLSYSELEALDARPAAAGGPSGPPAASERPAVSPPRMSTDASPATQPASEVPKKPPAPDPEAIKASLRESARLRAAVEAAAAAPSRSEGGEIVESPAAREERIRNMVEADELKETVAEVSGDVDPLDFARKRTREQLAAHAYDDVLADARRQREARAAEKRSVQGSTGADTFAWDQPLVRRLRFPWSWWRGEANEEASSDIRPNQDPLRLDRLGEPQPVARVEARDASRVNPAPSSAFMREEGATGVLPPGDPVATKRAREMFMALGYRVEGLAHGQLMLHADYGRRFERVLIHVLPDGERLEWGVLLNRRRESSANFLAVVGDDRDLVKQTASAELAKATLWSWSGLQRVVDLAQSMPLSPFDLRGHFERDGLFEYGLDRFERHVARRLQERGALSAVLERLAQMRPPSIFMLEDVASEANLPRDQALRALEHLAAAPWQLVSRVDSGEFCLLYRAADALQGMADYVDSMRARLPGQQPDVLRGLPADVDPIEAEELVVTDVAAFEQGGPPTLQGAPDARDAKGEPAGGTAPVQAEALLPVARRQGVEQPLLIPEFAKRSES